jgi:hypothetical protein
MLGRILALVCVCFLSPAITSAADGTLKIRFKYDGQAPKPQPIAGVAGVPFCGPLGLTDESLVVGPKGELQNIVMWMHTTSMNKAPENPAALKAFAKEVKVDNKNCRYEPRITMMHTSQTLVVGNPDPMGHNTKGDLFVNPSFNVLIPAGGSSPFKFPKPERRPMPLGCNIHPWMSGWLLIQDHPYYGASDANGSLTIANIPEGKYTFTIWHEKPGFVKQGKQNGKVSEWKTGRIDVTIAGDTDLGEFLIKP